MKRQIISTLLFLSMFSCTQPQTDHVQKDVKPKEVKSSLRVESFDLATLVLNEKLPVMMAAYGIKPETVSPSDLTLMGLEIFKSSNPKVLQFGGKALSGNTGANSNHVLFHYNANNKLLALYELNLYTKEEIYTLVSQLLKLGKPSFEKAGTSAGAIEIDENGDEVKPGAGEAKRYRVWENKKNKLSYFLIETENQGKVKAELTVLKASEPSGKDWIKMRSFDWYKP